MTIKINFQSPWLWLGTLLVLLNMAIVCFVMDYVKLGITGLVWAGFCLVKTIAKADV